MMRLCQSRWSTNQLEPDGKNAKKQAYTVDAMKAREEIHQWKFWWIETCICSRRSSNGFGNSSPVEDGCVLCDGDVYEKMVKELNLEPIARMVTYTAVGVHPRIMGIGPVEAVPKALKQAGLKQIRS